MARDKSQGNLIFKVKEFHFGLGKSQKFAKSRGKIRKFHSLVQIGIFIYPNV